MVSRPASRGRTGTGRRALGSYGVDRQAFITVFGGVLGGMAGAAFVLLVTQKEAALAREDVVQLRAEVQARLTNIDHAMEGLQRASEAEHGTHALEPRVRVLPPAPVSVTDPAPSADADDPVRVGSPLFEAAVLDIIDRSDDARDAERAAAREEMRRRREKYWADELTMRLGLTPAQTERLLVIQAELTRTLDGVRRETADGRSVPREQRRTARQAARQHADDQLRAVFTRQQVIAYEALDDKLKLYRQRDPD